MCLAVSEQLLDGAPESLLPAAPSLRTAPPPPNAIQLAKSSFPDCGLNPGSGQ